MNNEKAPNFRNVQLQSLVNAIREAEEKGIDINEILSEQSIKCLELLKLGKTYEEISLDIGMTIARVKNLMTGHGANSALTTIRRHIALQKKGPKNPNLDEIVAIIKSVDVDELYSAIDRLKKPALSNIYREIINGKEG
ncbi:hypothetical protein [Paenibacillus amylolyticus]|uniref:Uncharacterized protein n=1 Tax=Paenibacillus amylolyticus TaxID=1451 RepID=A0ABD8B2Q6_PAEAM